VVNFDICNGCGACIPPCPTGAIDNWRDVEVTVYAQRIRDSGISFAGITMVARSNHLRTDDAAADLCDTRGYGGRLRFDGHADFEKETAHPRNESIRKTQVFPGGLPFGVWIGVKFLVYDRSDGVHLELWLDRTDGRDGGQWELVNQVVDDGRLFGSVPCAPGIDPRMALTNSPDREGSESGKPNLSVYFRSDGIAPAGMVYKWASIREISP
jgi:ferredoxin